MLLSRLHDKTVLVRASGTGVYGFTIRLKNGLTNQNQALFSGKFKVAKVVKSKGKRGILTRQISERFQR